MVATNPDSTPGWAQWLQDRLDERGWVQADLYNRSGGVLTRARVSRWIAGATPDIEGIRDACAVLGVRVGTALIESGLLRQEDVDGVTVIAPQPLTKREVLDWLTRRIPDDVASSEHLTPPTPIRKRRDQPLLTPEGEEGRDWVAWEPDES